LSFERERGCSGGDTVTEGVALERERAVVVRERERLFWG